MSKFTEAFSLGQAKATEAQSARNEIGNVLDQAKEEIFRASGEKIVIGVAKFSPLLSKPMVVNVRTIGVDKKASLSSTIEEYWIIAMHLEHPEIVKLSKWSQEDGGFPCSMLVDRIQLRCMNREALEEALVRLFASTNCAEQFRILMNLS